MLPGDKNNQKQQSRVAITRKSPLVGRSSDTDISSIGCLVVMRPAKK